MSHITKSLVGWASWTVASGQHAAAGPRLHTTLQRNYGNHHRWHRDQRYRRPAELPD